MNVVLGGLVFHFDCERKIFWCFKFRKKILLNCSWSTLENQILKLFTVSPKCTIFCKYYNSLVNSSTADLSHFNRPTWHGITSTQVLKWSTHVDHRCGSCVLFLFKNMYNKTLNVLK